MVRSASCAASCRDSLRPGFANLSRAIHFGNGGRLRRRPLSFLKEGRIVEATIVGADIGEASLDFAADRIAWVGISSILLPLKKSVSDAKVLTGRQKALDSVSILTATIIDAAGREGFGFGYCLRAGGAGQYAHACELAAALVGEDSNDIGRVWSKLAWLGARRGGAARPPRRRDFRYRPLGLNPSERSFLANSSGLTVIRCPVQHIGGYLQAPIEEVLRRRGSISRARDRRGEDKGGHRIAPRSEGSRLCAPISGIPCPSWWTRTAVGRATAFRMCRGLDDLGLTWIEEPWTLMTRKATPPGRGHGHADRTGECYERRRARGLIEKKSSTSSCPSPAHRWHHAIFEGGGSGRPGQPCIAPHFVMEITCIWRPATPAKPGSSISSGSNPFSRKGWRFPAAAWPCRRGRGSGSR